MAQFTPDEIKDLKATSNGKSNEVWMSRWKEGNETITSASDDNHRRRFLVRKYVNKEWYSVKTQKLDTPQTKPLIKAPPPQQANSAPPVLLDFESFQTRPVVDDLIDFSAIPPPRPRPGPAPVVYNESPKQKPAGSLRDELKSLVELVPNARPAVAVHAGPTRFHWD
jgi:hypothetical protein